MSESKSARDESWWDEFRRDYGNVPLRELARRYGTNPRRLRRAAQRAGLTTEDERIAELENLLGTMPDITLADRANVTPEKIKGARRKRAIDPFNPQLRKKQREETAAAKARATREARPPRRAEPVRERKPMRRSWHVDEPTVVVTKRRVGRAETPRSAFGEDRLSSRLARVRSEPAESRTEGPVVEKRRRRIVPTGRAEEMRGLRDDRRTTRETAPPVAKPAPEPAPAPKMAVRRAPRRRPVAASTYVAPTPEPKSEPEPAAPVSAPEPVVVAAPKPPKPLAAVPKPIEARPVAKPAPTPVAAEPVPAPKPVAAEPAPAPKPVAAAPKPARRRSSGGGAAAPPPPPAAPEYWRVMVDSEGVESEVLVSATSLQEALTVASTKGSVVRIEKTAVL
jgi:hypothetical protein